jgi:hypothetical protein
MKKAIIDTVLGLIIVLTSLFVIVFMLVFFVMAAQACLSSEAFDLTMKAIAALVLAPVGLGLILQSKELGARLTGYKEKK